MKPSVKSKKALACTETLKQLHQAFKGTCQYCFEKVPLKNACKDHIYPDKKGNEPFNLVLVCKSCNQNGIGGQNVITKDKAGWKIVFPYENIGNLWPALYKNGSYYYLDKFQHEELEKQNSDLRLNNQAFVKENKKLKKKIKALEWSLYHAD